MVIHDGDIALEDVKKEQIKLKLDLSHIKQGSINHPSKHKQCVILKIFITQEKKFSKCLMIMLRISPEI